MEDKIIDYVAQTPENTNPAVLNTLLGDLNKQPDWNQNDETAPDYVKNRPFYTGDSVETALVEESTASFIERNGLYIAEFLSTFEATVGETYKVSWDGTIYECICVDVDGPLIGNLSITGADTNTGEPFLMSVFNGQGIIIMTSDTSASHTFSISGIVSETVKIDEKYIPENIATKSDVEVIQTAVDNAQAVADAAKAVADNAQTAADAAKAVADNNKEVLCGAFNSVVTFTFDKQISGRDAFVFNSFHYYKISDFNPAPEAVISFKGTRENGLDYSKINAGNNCVEYGLFIVVSSAGDCSLPIKGTVTGRFTAPSAGLYAMYNEGNITLTAGKGEFTLMSIDSLTIRSSTDGSTKKFKITVDDSGAITATEVT